MSGGSPGGGYAPMNSGQNGFGGAPMSDYSLTGGTGGFLKSGGNDAPMTDPNAPATAPAPLAPSGQPAATAGGYGSGPVNIQGPGNFIGTPFRQTYGGEPPPYDSHHAQILDAFRNNSTGAGRFGSNNASRYANFAGGSFWRPDTGNYNLGREMVGGPFQSPQYNPQAPLQAPPMGQAPGGGINPPPQGGQPLPSAPPGGVDHMQNFQKLLQQDPSGRLAAGYTQYGGARDWLQKNQGAVGGMVPGGFAGWRGQYGGGNRFLEGGEEQNLMRMAGLKV